MSSNKRSRDSEYKQSRLWAQRHLLRKLKRREIQARERENELRREKESKQRRKEKTQFLMSRFLRGIQATVAVLCGFETGRKHRFGYRVRFRDFAAEIVNQKKEKDMYEFITLLGSVNVKPGETAKTFPEYELRPLLRILDGLYTPHCSESYDDTDDGPDSDPGYFALAAENILEFLSFANLQKLTKYLAKHGFKDLGIQILDSGPLVKLGFNYEVAQYVSALRHIIDIILSATHLSEQEKDRAGSVSHWIAELGSQPWWALNRFVVDIGDWVHVKTKVRWMKEMRVALEERMDENELAKKAMKEKERGDFRRAWEKEREDFRRAREKKINEEEQAKQEMKEKGREKFRRTWEQLKATHELEVMQRKGEATAKDGDT